MPKSKRLTHKERKARLIESFRMAELSRRQCGRCRERKLPCKVNLEADRCLECIQSGVNCSLAPISVPRWKRLQERREQLEREHGEALAKAHRTYTEIESIRAVQNQMVKQELENIEVQEREEEEAKLLSRTTTETLLGSGGDFPDLGDVDWSSLAADFVAETQPASRGN